MTRTEPGTDPYEDPFQRHSYKSVLIEQLKANGGRLRSGRVTVRTAPTFGFCWGVDRAVAMVRDAFQEYPGRRIWLLDQIIHNPVVNEDFRLLGARFLRGPFAEESEAQLGPDDVVWVNRRPITATGMTSNIKQLHAENPQAKVVVTAHPESTTGLLVKVIDSSRLAGVSDVSLAQAR